MSRFIRELIEEKLKFHKEINKLNEEIERLNNLPEKQIIAKLEADVAELKRDKVAYNH